MCQFLTSFFYSLAFITLRTEARWALEVLATGARTPGKILRRFRVRLEKYERNNLPSSLEKEQEAIDQEADDEGEVKVEIEDFSHFYTIRS